MSHKPSTSTFCIIIILELYPFPNYIMNIRKNRTTRTSREQQLFFSLIRNSYGSSPFIDIISKRKCPSIPLIIRTKTIHFICWIHYRNILICGSKIISNNDFMYNFFITLLPPTRFLSEAHDTRLHRALLRQNNVCLIRQYIHFHLDQGHTHIISFRYQFL